MPDLAQSMNGEPQLPAIWPDLCRRFRDPKLIGQGTCADVYAAFDSLYNRKVALKIAKTSDANSRHGQARSGAPNAQGVGVEDHSKRTRVEGELLRAFHHRNIIECYEILDCNDERSGQRYVVLVLEYASGGELYQYLSTMQTLLSETEARRFFKQIVSAVAFCHERAIVHRDLKLENILLSNRQDPVVKLADFGLAERFDPSGRELLATYCGSLLYASPELMQNRPYRGPEVDCWALGVILYSLVCGRMPFRTADPAATAHIANLSAFEHALLTGKIVRAEFDLPDAVRRNRPLADLVGGLLNPDASRRYSCSQILSHSWLGGPPAQQAHPTLSHAASTPNAAANALSQHNNAMLLGQHHLAVTNPHSGRVAPVALANTSTPRFNSYGAAKSHDQYTENANGDAEMSIVPIPVSAPKRFNQPNASLNAFRSTHNINNASAYPGASMNSITPQTVRRPLATERTNRASADRDFTSRPATRLDVPHRASSRAAERRKTTTGFDSQTQRELETLFGSDATRWPKTAPAVSASDITKLADSERLSAPAPLSSHRDDSKPTDASSKSIKTDAENFRFADDDEDEPDAGAGIQPSSVYATLPRNRRRTAGLSSASSSGIHLNARTAALLSSEAERLTELINGVSSTQADVTSRTSYTDSKATSNETSKPPALDAADRVSLSEMLPLSITAFRERFGKSSALDSDPNNNQRRNETDESRAVANEERPSTDHKTHSSSPNDRLDSSPERFPEARIESAAFGPTESGPGARASSTTPAHLRNTFGGTPYFTSSAVATASSHKQQTPTSTHSGTSQSSSFANSQPSQFTPNAFTNSSNQIASSSAFLPSDPSHPPNFYEPHSQMNPVSTSFGHSHQSTPSFKNSYGTPTHAELNTSRSPWPQHASHQASPFAADHAAPVSYSSQFHEPLQIGRSHVAPAYNTNRSSPRSARRSTVAAPPHFSNAVHDDRAAEPSGRHVTEPRWKANDPQPHPLSSNMALRTARAPSSVAVPTHIPTTAPIDKPHALAPHPHSRLAASNAIMGRSALDVTRSGRTQPPPPPMLASGPPPSTRMYTTASPNHYGTMANIAQGAQYPTGLHNMQSSNQPRSTALAQQTRSVRRTVPVPRAAPLNNAQSMHNIVNAGQPVQSFEFDPRRTSQAFPVGPVGRSTLAIPHGDESEYDFGTASSASGGSHERRPAPAMRSQVAFTGAPSRFDRDYHEFGAGYFGSASRPKSAGMLDDFETRSEASDYEGESRFAYAAGPGITLR